MNFIKPKWIPAIFFLMLLAVFFFFGFHLIFNNSPNGIHFMRQTDSLSFANQYFNNGFDFFNPRLYNLNSQHGKAACEFPIVYYFTSFLYFLFGKNPAVLKTVHLIIIYLGIYHVYKLAYIFLKNQINSILISFFVFTSTVFNFYSFNFLPDTAALGFVLIGIYYMFKYYQTDKNKVLIMGFVFLTLGGLIKITYFINPFAFLVLAFLSLVFPKIGIIKKHQATRTIIYIVVSTLLVVLWNYYIITYNTKYGAYFFITEALPIWTNTKAEIKHVIWSMTKHWRYEYLAFLSFVLLIVLSIVQSIFIRKSENKLNVFTLILSIGTVCYFLLMFIAFKDHDYYFLGFFPAIILLLLNGVFIFQKIANNNIKLQKVISLVLAAVVLLGMIYSRKRLSERHNKGKDHYSHISYLIAKDLPEIRALNTHPKSTFIIAPDKCFNGGLSLIDRHGWIVDNEKEITPNKIYKFKKTGANYLVVDNAFNLNLPDSTGKLLLKGKKVSVFELNAYK